MKKTFIILGIILLIIIGAVWVYLFMYGVPKDAGEVFARFRTDGGTPTFVGNGSDSTVDTAPVTEGGRVQRLRQLTTRPVAGAITLNGSVRYAEQGTGHVYDIDLQNGVEKMVSGTTIPKTVRAVFSSTGDQAAFTTLSNGSAAVVTGNLTQGGGEGSFEGNTLPPGAREVSFSTASNTLNYYLPSAGGGTAYAYNLLTKKSVELFTTPLRDVRIIWGKDTYVYTTPSVVQTGYVYHEKSGVLGYVTGGGKGLMALPYDGGVIVTTNTEKGLTSLDATRNTSIPIIALMPEKCAASGAEKGILFCGVPTSFDETKKYPDDWYKGVATFSDRLFRVNAPSSTIQTVSSLEQESGRPIDISFMGISTDGKLLYFINKYDNTLWAFDLQIAAP